MTIRPPQRSEWRACRMLLPESFGPHPPEAYLAWDERVGAIAGLTAFHRLGRETVRTGVTTVLPYRRQGIASALLRRVVDRAIERGDERVCADVDLIAHPEADDFLQANGFLRGRVVREVKCDLAVGRGPLLELHARLVASGRIPANTRIATSRDFSLDEMERIYIDLLVPIVGTPAELARFTVTRPDFDAMIVSVGDTPAGIIVCVYNDGSGTAAIRWTAVAPHYRGWGWVELLLLVGALNRGWEAGARWLLFECDESNSNMMHQAERLNPVVLRRQARFVRELGAPSGS